MRKPNKNKMAGVNSRFASVSESIFNGFLLKMLLRSLPLYILKQVFFSISVSSGRIFTSPLRGSAGAHHQEPATTPYSSHGVFTNRSIFSLNLSRIQIPTGTSVTNSNHKHGLMLTCRYDVDMFTWGCIALSLPKRAHVHWNWPISREK